MNPLIFALIYLVSANYADYLTTLIGLTRFHLVELNPYASSIISSTDGWMKWLLLKTLSNLVMTPPTLLLSIPYKPEKPLHFKALNTLRSIWLLTLSSLGTALWIASLLNILHIIQAIT